MIKQLRYYIILGMLIPLGIIISAMFYLVPLELLTVFIVVTFCSFIGILYIIKSVHDRKDSLFLVKLFVGSFLLKILLVLVVYSISINSGGNGILGVADERGFDEVGWEIAQILRRGETHIGPILFRISKSNWGYYLFNGLVYFVFGHNPLAIELINSFFGSMILIFAFRVAAVIFSQKTARITAFLVAFNPTIIFWSVFNLKDVLFSFLLVVTCWYVLSLAKEWSIRNFLKLIILSLILFTIRDSFAFIWIAVYSIYLLKNSTLKLISWGLIAIIFVFSLISFSNLASPFGRIGKVLSQGEFSSFWVRTQRSIETSHGGEKSSIVSGVLMSSPIDFLKFLPLGVTRFLLTPLPWKATGTHTGLVPGTIFWYFLMPFTFYGIYFSVKGRVKGAFLLLGFIIAVVGILSTLFLGGSPRHQMPIIPLYMIFASVGLLNFSRIKMIYLISLLTLSSAILAFAVGVKIFVYIVGVFVLIMFLVVYREKHIFSGFFKRIRC